MESLLFFIVIIAISALSNWLKRKQEEQQKQGHLPPDAPADAAAPAEAPQPRKPWDWETELRRLFDDRPEPASSPPAEPPPVIRPPEPSPAAAPAARPAPPPPPPTRPSPVPAFKEEMNAAKQRLHERLAALKRADTAYSRAQRLDQNVSARLDQLGELRQELGRMELKARPQRGPRSSPAVRRVRRALGRPQTAREAIIAAEILARPPGLQP